MCNGGPQHIIIGQCSVQFHRVPTWCNSRSVQCTYCDHFSHLQRIDTLMWEDHNITAGQVCSSMAIMDPQKSRLLSTWSWSCTVIVQEPSANVSRNIEVTTKHRHTIERSIQWWRMTMGHCRSLGKSQRHCVAASGPRQDCAFNISSWHIFPSVRNKILHLLLQQNTTRLLNNHNNNPFVLFLGMNKYVSETQNTTVFLLSLIINLY